MYSRTSCSTVRTVRRPDERRGCPPVDLDTPRSPGPTRVGLVDPLLRGDMAPPPRTLVDIFRATVEQAADEPAVDAGNERADLRRAGRGRRRAAAELNAHGVGRGDRVGVRIRSGTTDLYVAILGILLAGAAYVPVDADDPDERARLVFDEADVAAIVGNDLAVVARRRRRPAREPGDRARRRRLGDLHLRLDGTPKGVAVTPPQRRGLRRRRVAAVPAGRAARRRRPGDGRPLGRLRRLLRGDVAGLAVRRLPGPGAARAGAQRDRRRPVAGGQRRSRSSPRSRPWSRCGRPRRWPRSGC